MIPKEQIFGLPEAAIGPITAALIAGLIALISLIITKEQKTSEFRQAWIDALRSDIASFIAAVNALRDIDRLELAETENWELQKEHYMAANEALVEAKLRLNPEDRDSDCSDIITSMEGLANQFSLGVQPSGPKIAYWETKLLQQSQRLLKSEWGRVKKGELSFQIAKWGISLLLAFTFIAFIVAISA